MALTKVKADGLTADLIDETKLADNSIDSEHYNDGSIDNAHLADDAVGTEEIADNAITNALMADDAVGVAELSATGTASSSTFLRGDNSWATPTDTNTQLAFANDANNRVVTGDGSGGLNGEANLTFDGNNLDVSGGCITTFGQNTTHEAASIKVGYEGSSKGQIRVYGADASTTGSLELNVCESDGTDPHTVTVKSNGNLEIGDGDLVIETAGHGINFHPHSGTANLLDDYETGTFTPLLVGYWSGSWRTTTRDGNMYATYTKVGRLCHVQVYFNAYQITGNGVGTSAAIWDLPFTAAGNSTYGILNVSHSNAFSNCNGGNFYVSQGQSYALSSQYGDNDYDYCTWSGDDTRYLMFSGTYETQ